MFIQKVRTVSKWKLALRLAAALALIPNWELERRLRRRAFYMRYSASWISAAADEIHSLWLPYWLVSGPKEWIRLWQLIRPLSDLEMSVAVLVYAVSGLSSTAMAKNDLLLLVSSREVLWALVPSRDHGLEIARIYDIELGKKR